MFHFHKHVFTKDGNTLWCTCGATRRLVCDHQWDVITTSEIMLFGVNRHIVQNQQCSICGEFRQIDLTSGVVS